ncbi:MAG TPA: aminopeptidase N [Jatrophihabitans sp.]|jgi:aminopeptidase N|uniref:aminopeptidase N n=1 Tax=Jatrophihabitans sp. TaxID=1932789 RepID=UPI002EF1C709
MPSLTRTEAAERGAVLTVGSYLIDLDLTTGADTFRSSTTISFDARPGSSAFLDVQPETLHSVLLNDTPVDVTALREGRLPLSGLAAENRLVVVADMRYSKECEGLHRYVDPADDQVYLYAFVYIDNAPRVFACFDQPDLKAPYTFTLTVPRNWQVLGNSEATQIEPGRWELGPTPPQATYLTTLVAGPYESVYHDHDGIRLGFHCRASLAEFLSVDLDEMFEVTGQCLDEYERLFGVRYPFGKLDHVFVPEFSLLSLDHPACVLLRELYLFRTPGTASERETRAVVLAHGISLQWMAALVTNAWWDDLWLGQAFADYMAHRVPSEVTRFPGPPTTFAARRKGQAYVADQRGSTHPISLDGPDVQTVLLEMDRISYFKGHSAIRQLAARVGTEALRAGLRTYFDRHAFGTATYADFLAALSDATGEDMTGWFDRWFKESNVNTLYPEIEVSGDVISAAAIVQTAPDSHPVLRPHTLHVGLYGGGRSTAIRVDIDGERTELLALIGQPAPEFVLLNDGDLTYAKIRFDESSLAALPRVLPTLSPLNRAMVWCQLLLAVQDAVFPAADHLELVTQMVAVESELSIITEVLEQARFDVADRFLAPAERPHWMDRIADSIRQRLARTEAGDERQMSLFRNLIDFSSDVAELRGFLDGVAVPDGIVLDPDTCWRIEYRLAVLGELDEAQIQAAFERDPSTAGEVFVAKARAARPDPAAKSAAWQAMTSDTTLSSYQIWALAEGFWQPEQLELTEPYVQRFFAEMPETAKLRGDLVLSELIRFLYPRYAATPDTVEFATGLMERSDISLPLRRRVADFTDDLTRVIRARESQLAVSG